MTDAVTSAPGVAAEGVSEPTSGGVARWWYRSLPARLIRLMPTPQRHQFAASLGLFVLAAACEVAAWLCLGPAVRGVIAGGGMGVDGSATWWLVIAGLAVVWAGAYAAATALGRSSGYGVAHHLHGLLGNHIRRVRLDWFSTDRTGEYSTLATGAVMQVMSLPAHLMGPLVTACATVICAAVCLAMVTPLTAVVAVVSVPVLWWVYRVTSRVVTTGEASLSASRADSAARVVEFADAQKTLRLAPRPGDAAALTHEALTATMRTTRKMVDETVPVLGGFVAATQVTFAALVAMVLVTSTTSPVATTVVSLLLCARFAMPLKTVAEMGAATRMAMGGVDRIERFLAEPVLPEPSAPVPVPAGPLPVVMADATVSYDGKQVVGPVSFTAEAGQITALVGPSGSGKSSLLRLAARFMDPSTGEVTLGGVPLPQIGQQGIHDAVSVVFQRAQLFDGTLAENIQMARPDCSEADLNQVIADAQLADVIAGLPAGLNTVVGTGGVTLSGGQQARVSLARALLKQAPVLLLDEITAHLDATTSAAVMATVARLRGTATVLLVTHQERLLDGVADHVVRLTRPLPT